MTETRVFLALVALTLALLAGIYLHAMHTRDARDCHHAGGNWSPITRSCTWPPR